MKIKHDKSNVNSITQVEENWKIKDRKRMLLKINTKNKKENKIIKSFTLLLYCCSQPLSSNRYNPHSTRRFLRERERNIDCYHIYEDEI